MSAWRNQKQVEHFSSWFHQDQAYILAFCLLVLLIFYAPPDGQARYDICARYSLRHALIPVALSAFVFFASARLPGH
jgi:hypothetical protein